MIKIKYKSTKGKSNEWHTMLKYNKALKITDQSSDFFKNFIIQINNVNFSHCSPKFLKVLEKELMWEKLKL